MVDASARHSADSAVRIRLTQALAEMPGTFALGALQRLAGDGDRAVALVASALVKVVGELEGVDGGGSGIS